jgi:hypothetical protein
MITALAIIFIAALLGLGARPARRESPVAVKSNAAQSELRSGTAIGLYGEAAPESCGQVAEPVSASKAAYLAGSGEIIIGPGRIVGAWQDTRNTFVSRPETEDYFMPKTLPPCFVCCTTLTRPYPDRDYFCDKCNSFISSTHYR